jgi:hypothetical protein
MKVELTELRPLYKELIVSVQSSHVRYIVPGKPVIKTFTDFFGVYKHIPPKYIRTPDIAEPVKVIDVNFMLNVMHNLFRGKISVGGYLTNDEDIGTIMVNLQKILEDQRQLKEINQSCTFLRFLQDEYPPEKASQIKCIQEKYIHRIQKKLRMLSSSAAGLALAKDWYKKNKEKFPMDPVIHAETLIRMPAKVMSFKKANSIYHKLK